MYVYIHISGRISTSNCLEEDHSKDAIINLLPGTSTDAIVSREVSVHRKYLMNV